MRQRPASGPRPPVPHPLPGACAPAGSRRPADTGRRRTRRRHRRRRQPDPPAELRARRTAGTTVALRKQPRTTGRATARRSRAAGTRGKIPLATATIDAVVCCLVLCTVSDQGQALSEIYRVLRPEGQLVLLEHGAARPRTWLRQGQRLVAPFSRRFDRGCDPPGTPRQHSTGRHSRSWKCAT